MGVFSQVSITSPTTSSSLVGVRPREAGLFTVFSTFHKRYKLCQKEETSLTRCMKVKVAQRCSTLWDPMDYIVHGILQDRILEQVAFPFSKRLSQPRNQIQVSHIAGDSLPVEPQGKPKNTGVGSLSLLQQIFPTQESNQGLLHYRQILYQLSFGFLSRSETEKYGRILGGRLINGRCGTD